MLSEKHNPTLHELFRNTTLGPGEDYYLLISNLDTSRVDDHWVEKAVERFSALYPPVAHTSLRGDGLELAHAGESGWTDDGTHSRMSELLARMRAV